MGRHTASIAPRHPFVNGSTMGLPGWGWNLIHAPGLTPSVRQRLRSLTGYPELMTTAGREHRSTG